jgi:hypothetical protein
MPALIPTAFEGVITWLGVVQVGLGVMPSQRQAEVFASFAGVAGEVHGGLTRASCSRVTGQYPRGTEIRNVRQFSVVSAEELAVIARAMGLPGLDPSLLGASLVIAGIPDFTHLPPSSRLQFDGGATLVVDMENRPCTLPAKEIEAVHPGFGAKFKPAAKDRRGVTAWVEREGVLRLGAKVRLHLPDQRAWDYLPQARG